MSLDGERIPRPIRARGSRGTYVVIAGPDGSGKSTVVDQLATDVLPGPVRRLHHRPQLLRGLTSPDTVVTEPHGSGPYPRWVSTGKLLFLFADHLLGWWVRIRPWLRRGGDVILERGWWDLAVDPQRYRLRPAPRLVERLGRLLPRPDITVILDGDATAMATRKAELSVSETARQVRAWRSLPRKPLRAAYVDVSAPVDDVHTAVRDAVLHVGGDDRWVLLPTAAAPRWYFPAIFARAGVSALQLYHPVTPIGRVSWELARGVAALGGFRLLARDGWRPPEEALDLLAPFLPPGARVALARGRRDGRSNALILDGRTGAAHAFAKIACDDVGPKALAAEATAWERLAPLLPPGLRAPQVLHHQEHLVLFEPIISSSRVRPWSLPPEVAFLLGRFHRAGARDDGLGPAHGDCAPWNLVRAAGGWVLVDWSDGRADAPPFEDVFHFLVQAHSLLGRPSRSELLSALAGAGRTGTVIRCYAEGAGLEVCEAQRHFPSYLVRTLAKLDTSSADGLRGSRAREALLRSLPDGEATDRGRAPEPRPTAQQRAPRER